MSKVAERYGGGGHRHAAGIITDKLLHMEPHAPRDGIPFVHGCGL